MSEEASNHFGIPKEMQSIAEASFDQARQAFEKFLSNAQQTAGTIEETRRDGSCRRQGYRRQGDFLRREERAGVAGLRAVAAAGQGHRPKCMRLHGEYVQAQMRSLAEQASEMGQLVSRAAMEAAKAKN